jgi:uncharacterized protein HemX
MSEDKTERRERDEDSRILATTRSNGELVINSKAVWALFLAVAAAIGGSGFSMGGADKVMDEIKAVETSMDTLEAHLENQLQATEARIREECVLRVDRVRDSVARMQVEISEHRSKAGGH